MYVYIYIYIYLYLYIQAYTYVYIHIHIGISYIQSRQNSMQEFVIYTEYIYQKYMYTT